MTDPTAAIIAESHRLIAACQASRLALAIAYGWHRPATPPLEQPSQEWLAGRDAAEKLCGCNVRRDYSE